MRRRRRPNNALTDRHIRSLKQPGKYADGNGLYLVVDPSGNKRWQQRLTIRGKRRDIGLSGYPAVSLKAARETAAANKTLVLQGGDPIAEKRRQSVPNFAEAASRVIALNRPTWRNAKHAAQWTSTLETYAFPVLGELPVDRVSGADVLRVLTPIWTTKTETARRVRQRISAVMKWAIANEYRYDNPAGDAISAVLPKMPSTKAHFKALPYEQVADALMAVRGSNASVAARLGLEFLVLTAARSGEVRNARWDEIDVDSRVWTIPAERMKAGREHRVPLSERALAILEEMRELDADGGYVFPSSGKGRALSNMTFTQILRRCAIDCVPHGFRSSFRDWAAELTNTPRAVMEAALAHVVANATEAAYARSDLFERRRVLMEVWAAYLSL